MPAICFSTSTGLPEITPQSDEYPDYMHFVIYMQKLMYLMMTRRRMSYPGPNRAILTLSNPYNNPTVPAPLPCQDHLDKAE